MIKSPPMLLHVPARHPCRVRPAAVSIFLMLLRSLMLRALLLPATASLASLSGRCIVASCPPVPSPVNGLCYAGCRLFRNEDALPRGVETHRCRSGCDRHYGPRSARAQQELLSNDRVIATSEVIRSICTLPGRGYEMMLPTDLLKIFHPHGPSGHDVFGTFCCESRFFRGQAPRQVN